MTLALDALTRVSDDSGVTIPLLAGGARDERYRSSSTSQTEPWVDVNPGKPRQPRRDVAGGALVDWRCSQPRLRTSLDGGSTWTNIALSGVAIVAGGEFQRVTDPWVDFGPSNRVYGTSLAFDDTAADNAIFVHTSTGRRPHLGARPSRS